MKSVRLMVRLVHEFQPMEKDIYIPPCMILRYLPFLSVSQSARYSELGRHLAMHFIKQGREGGL